MTIEFIDENGKFMKQWSNWGGVIPLKDDRVLLQFGDNNEKLAEYYVLYRGITGTDPDKIILMVKELKL